jgi:hypothetical protein
MSVCYFNLLELILPILEEAHRLCKIFKLHLLFRKTGSKIHLLIPIMEKFDTQNTQNTQKK